MQLCSEKYRYESLIIDWHEIILYIVFQT